MIKEKDIAEFRPQVRFQNGQGITLDTVKNALTDCARANSIPVAFESDQVKFGGLIGGKTEDCLVLYHPDHRRDYFNFVITVAHQSSYAFVSVYGGGESKQMKKQDAAAAAKASASSVGKSAMRGIMNYDDSIGGMFSNAAGMAKGTAKLVGSLASGIRSLGGSKEKLQQEQNWYAMVSDIFDEIVS